MEKITINNSTKTEGKLRTLTFLITGCLLSFTLLFCKNDPKDDHSRQKQGYRIIENANNLQDCSVYSMVFDDVRKYAFRFAVSGKCPTLTKDQYLSYYTNFLRKYKDSISIKNGQLIQVNFNKGNGIDKNTIEQMALLTKDIIKKQTSIKEFSEESGIAVLDVQ